MCGIGGIYTFDRAIDRHLSVLADMVSLMRRRGPDDEGSWTDHQHIALGFRRLAIIDLTPAGHQPMVSVDGRYALIFNGELYNYRELRNRLVTEGVLFQSQSDTEVVLQALICWGEKSLNRFNGMFALAWYDSFTHTLLLARDPMGIKPLYYTKHPEGVIFGSQYDQLMVHPFCDKSKIRAEVLNLYLRLGYVPAPYGILANTFQLEPGRFLKALPSGDVTIGRFYRFSDPQTSYLSGAEAVDAVEYAIRSSVRRQMVSDVPIGSFLSGGIDSPLVTAAMQQELNTPVQAFTITSTNPKYDESEAAARYAQYLNVSHNMKTISGEFAVSQLEQLAQAYSEPFADYSAMPTMLVSDFAHENVKVTLSGDGGDELFWGYPRFKKVLNALHYFDTPRPFRNAAYWARRFTPAQNAPQGILYKNIGEWYFAAHSHFKAADLKRLCLDRVEYPTDFDLFDYDQSSSEDDVAHWLRTNEMFGHLQMVLLKVDRASMYYGLEVRVPLLDLQVVECASRIAPRESMGVNTGKILLRKTLSRFVPQSIISHGKKGFDPPLAEWLRSELRPLVEDLLLSIDPFPVGAFRRDVIATMWHEHLTGKVERTKELWNLLALQLWAKTHLATPQGRLLSVTIEDKAVA